MCKTHTRTYAEVAGRLKSLVREFMNARRVRLTLDTFIVFSSPRAYS